VVDYRWELLVQDGVVLNLERFFSTLGIASIIMPALIGIVADRWINAENYMEYYINGLAIFIYPKLIDLQHFMGYISSYDVLYAYNFLINSVAYNILKQ
jgi:NHS family xanthosine MFS transporter